MKTAKRKRPAKQRAREIANYMKRCGKIVSASQCEQCGSSPKPIVRWNGAKQSRLEMHHPDHRFPSVIVWLCSVCHHKLHGQDMASNDY